MEGKFALCKTLESLGEDILVSTYTLWDQIDDPYSSVPTMSFSNNLINEGDFFYEKLAELIFTFKGRVKWVLYH